jgi:hypothetical protein
LHADRIREDRRGRKQKNAVEQFQSAEIEDVEFHIIEGFHDREHVPLWIVQLASRVERATIHELKIKAHQLGGWYSSFKKDSADRSAATEPAQYKECEFRNSENFSEVSKIFCQGYWRRVRFLYRYVNPARAGALWQLTGLWLKLLSRRMSVRDSTRRCASLSAA